MSERILGLQDIFTRIERAVKEMNGDDLANLHNELADGPEVIYNGDDLFTEEMKYLGNAQKIDVVLEIFAGIPAITAYEDSEDAEVHVRGFFDSQNNLTEGQREIAEGGTREELLSLLSDWIDGRNTDEVHWFKTRIEPKSK